MKEGDLVLYDRNNHKSNNQGALQLAGGIPIYLEHIDGHTRLFTYVVKERLAHDH